jgi:cytolysin-activating lysine-acyltransferase
MVKSTKASATIKAGARGKPVANGASAVTKQVAKMPEAPALIHAEIGRIILAMMNLPRYCHQSLRDVRHLILDPLTRDRIAVARSKQGDGADGADATIGFAIWASVSATVAAKIAEQIKAGVFPIRLAADDWTSGDQIWLIDLIAPNRQLATSVFLNFRKAIGLKPMQIHPNVSRIIDKEVLETLKAKPASS